MAAPRKRPAPDREGERGFAMIALVVLMISAVTIGLISFQTSQPRRDVDQTTESRTDLRRIREAIVAYYISTEALPCPDRDGDGLADEPCTTATDLVGQVPYKTLGLPRPQSLDAHGNPVTYAIGKASETLQVTNTNGDVLVRDFVIVGHGPNGRPTRAATEANAASANEKENADIDLSFMDSDRNFDHTDSDYFDDVLEYGTIDNLLTSSAAEKGGTGANSLITQALDKSADGGDFVQARTKTAPDADLAGTDDVLYFGGTSDDPDTYDATASNDETTSCAWSQTTYPLTTETLRGFIGFQFLPGEASATQTKGTGQGFALMMIPGTRSVTSGDGLRGDACGATDANDSFGYKGIDRPKLAVEFDIYEDQYEGSSDSSSGRANPRPEGNHVALLFGDPDRSDYIGHGSQSNPDCNKWGTYYEGPAVYGQDGPCTYPPGDPDDYASGRADPRPARHATRPANWLEDGVYTDATLGSAGQPYVARFEIKRNCDSSCVICGGGGTYMSLKVWVACNADGKSDVSAGCPTLDGLDDLTEAYTEDTDYMVNYCAADFSVGESETFDTVKLGIGFSARNSAIALILHRFEALSQ